MTRYEELLAAVTANIGDDAPRLAFADHIRASEPDRARFIEDQIARASARRAERRQLDSGEHPLLRAHRAEWTRLVAKYARRWTFDRGFVAQIAIEPNLFLEYGEWLMVNFPLQVVELTAPEGAFPAAELAASPLLARLDALILRDARLHESELAQLIASPHLGRLLYCSLDTDRVAPATYERIAGSPDLRKLLVLSLGDDGPGQRFADTGRDDMQGRAVHAWTDLSAEGKALEARYGYVPWLHPEHNWCEPLDAAWLLAHGVLPARAAGSPVG
jgi:uncharacterized protein (TIGR02996 family)